eukprot:CAMPEP_0169232350 /NCGR_PEP_ID=MMETSP1016-20121227/27035_1 /TAXON_ID=342587 /ORGANISM="Karlodinium micrum, Strain CCMP2283" /LENGTH=198 /DNA_ID=CAMNT_0009311619 /DNA_START=330 /DNA_END=923 /DNA_ORIENTATION=-
MVLLAREPNDSTEPCLPAGAVACVEIPEHSAITVSTSIQSRVLNSSSNGNSNNLDSRKLNKEPLTLTLYRFSAPPSYDTIVAICPFSSGFFSIPLITTRDNPEKAGETKSGVDSEELVGAGIVSKEGTEVELTAGAVAGVSPNSVRTCAISVGAACAKQYDCVCPARSGSSSGGLSVSNEACAPTPAPQPIPTSPWQE